MNKNLRIVVLVLSLIAFSQVYASNNREVVVWEQSFESGFGSFNYWPNENDEMMQLSSYWSYDSERGCIVGPGECEELSAPEIDLKTSLYSTLKLVIDNDLRNVVYNTKLKVEIRKYNYNGWENDTETIDIPYNNSNLGIDFFETELSLDKYINQKIQMKFRVENKNYNTTWSIRSIKILGVDEYKDREEVTVSDLNDINNVEEGALVTLNLDNALLSFSWNEFQVLKSGNGLVAINAINRINYPNYYYAGNYMSGTVKGVLTYRIGFPLLEYITFNLEGVENENGWEYEGSASANTDEDYWNLVGRRVSFSYDFPKDYIFENYWNIDVSRGAAYYYNIGDYRVRCEGLALPYNGQKRIILAGVPNIYLLDTDDYNGEANPLVTMEVYKTCKAGQWNTLILPFDFYTDKYYPCAVFSGESDGVLQFTTMKNNRVIYAGTPFLIYPKNNDMDQFYPRNGASVINAVTPQTQYGTNYNFVGTFKNITPKEGSYYLSANNTIKPISKGGTIKSFRAYFEPSTPNASLARAISIDGEVTAIENINFGDDILFGQPKKIYNLNGQYVGGDLDALPKGVYLVNGKKVTK